MRYLFVFLFVFSLAACGDSEKGGTSSANQPARLGHVGQWFVDDNGRVVVLYGINMVRKRETYAPSDWGFDEDDIEYIAAQGFNTLRLGFTWKGLEPNPSEYDREYLRKIMATARLAGEAGLWVLLDFHQDMYNEKYQGQGVPDWAVIDDGVPLGILQNHPDNYWSSPALSRAYENLWNNASGPDGRGLADALASAWGEIAREAKGLPGLLGYDIMNEPWPGDRWAECAVPGITCPEVDLLLYNVQRASMRAIREHDSRSMVFYEPWVMFNHGVDTAMPDFEDDLAGFSYHKYCLFSEDCHSEVMANAVRRSEETGDALLLTEYLDLGFGFQTAMIESFASRQFWAWRAYDCCYREYGVIHRLGEPPTPDNLDQNLLDLIVQPNSRAIAGTPIAASYDFEDKRYTLEYSPVPISGGSPPDTGWRTEIFVPQRHYPLGYVVEVNNGTVVSEKDAPLLIVQAVSMAERVSLTVTPR